MSDERRERRGLRKHLMARGWVVESRVSGAIDVEIPIRTSEAAFLEEVRRTVRECGQEPDAYPTSFDRRRWIRITTAETVAEKGRGGHRRRHGA